MTTSTATFFPSNKANVFLIIEEAKNGDGCEFYFNRVTQHTEKDFLDLVLFCWSFGLKHCQKPEIFHFFLQMAMTISAEAYRLGYDEMQVFAELIAINKTTRVNNELFWDFIDHVDDNTELNILLHKIILSANACFHSKQEINEFNKKEYAADLKEDQDSKRTHSLTTDDKVVLSEEELLDNDVNKTLKDQRKRDRNKLFSAHLNNLYGFNKLKLQRKSHHQELPTISENNPLTFS